ncbi:MAG: L,D-transpeptidase family protein [Erythrobacter sp.]|nr:L,D-transpeptidase family protein [Erythrobacter sp.]
MKQAIALVFLATAACVSPAGDSGSERENSAVVPEPRVASRSYPTYPQQRVSRIADYLLVDKSDRMLVAYSRGRPIRVYYGLQFGDAPIGHKRFEGDERTPEGIYTIHTRNPNSSYHLSLRIDYPNSADRTFAARYGRSAGGDIFIHGQPNGLPSNRRMRGDWTDGCIALTNAEIEELWSIVPDGTPIEIRQ